MTQNTRDLARNRIAATSLIIGITVLTATGCASSPGAPANVPNPFNISGSPSAEIIQVHTLRVFGDSYTDPLYTRPRGLVNWVDDFVRSGRAAAAENYALGGAKAASGEVRSFDRQLATWASKSSPVSERDLTITYFGYNDVGRNGSKDNLASAKAGYSAGIADLVARGAASGNNRIFVTQIHDWSRNPGVNTANTKDLILDINNFVGGVANANPNIVAVDLFTTFNKILDNPTTYGFTNVSKAEPSKVTSTALFYDDIHFGSRGFQIVSRVYQYYLTRAWSWANAYGAGSKAAKQLSDDIDKGLLVLSMADNNARLGSAFSLMPLGIQQTPSHDGSVHRHAFVPFQPGQTTPQFSGLALNYNLQKPGVFHNANFGFAIHQNSTDTTIQAAESNSSLAVQSNAASVYWSQPISNFLLTSQLVQASHRFGQNASDDILQNSISNLRTGQGWSFENKLRYTYGTSMAQWTPWVSLTQEHQTLNSGVLSSLYTSDVHYSSTSASQLISGLGLDLQFAPIHMNGGKTLYLSGSLAHRASLHQAPLTVTMQEAAQPWAPQVETIQQSAINQTYFSLNAQLQLSPSTQLSAAYSTDLNQRKSTQAVQVRANFKF